MTRNDAVGLVRATGLPLHEQLLRILAEASGGWYNAPRAVAAVAKAKRFAVPASVRCAFEKKSWVGGARCLAC